jgi:hypothetical protein
MRQERESWEVLSVSWNIILKRISAVIGSVCSILGIKNVSSSKTLVLHCYTQNTFIRYHSFPDLQTE